MSTFDSLISDLTRDARRVQPKDALQFCASWFQSRLEEQRARTRDLLLANSAKYGASGLPLEFYRDTPQSGATSDVQTVSPFSPAPPRVKSSSTGTLSTSPFGTLNVPGNALVTQQSMSNQGRPTFTINGQELPAPSPLATGPSPFGSFDPSGDGEDFLVPSSAVLARRTSVSAESIRVDSNDPIPVFTKTPEQLERIKASIKDNFIFRGLDEEQERGAVNAMQERRVEPNEVVVVQGDVGDFFYVVESGVLDVYIHPEPLPPSWAASSGTTKFVQPGYHGDYGRKVAECKSGSSFGELALMYGHPRKATVMATEKATLWAVDRITFRTIILKAAHRRRTMYEQFLSSVPLLSSLENEERSKVADALVSHTIEDGQHVVVEGELGDTFYFVEDGEAVVTKKSKDGSNGSAEVGRLSKGDYFGGEDCLTSSCPRTTC